MNSPERPLGEVECLFAREEYQCSKGNLSHLHMLVTLKKGWEDDEGRRHIKALVRGFVDDILPDEDVESMIQEGLLKDYYDAFEVKEEAMKFLPHRHSARCLRRVGPGSSDLVCRVPDARFVSTDITGFYTAHLGIGHSKDAL